MQMVFFIYSSFSSIKEPKLLPDLFGKGYVGLPRLAKTIERVGLGQTDVDVLALTLEIPLQGLH